MDYEEIKKIMNDMGNSKLQELNIEFPDGLKIGMKKNDIDKQNIKQPSNQNVEPENVKEIKSPMVGTFYSSSSPKEEPFVKVGDKVKKGQVLCIIEAMKLMNEIQSEFDGEIQEICVNNEEIVDYGKTLFKIK